MNRKFHTPSLVALLISSFLLVLTNKCEAQQDNVDLSQNFTATNSRGIELGDPQNAVQDLKDIYKVLLNYKIRHEGKLPKNTSSLIRELAAYPKDYGFNDFFAARKAFSNPDYKLTDSKISEREVEKTWIYVLPLIRPSGEPFPSSRKIGSREVLAWTNIYVYRNITYLKSGLSTPNTVGFYMVLWDDGSIEKIPFDEVFYYSVGNNGFKEIFPSQAGEFSSALSYEELNRGSLLAGKPLVADEDLPVADNGGPESLIQLSRRGDLSKSFGIDRNKLWNIFDPSQAEFTLSEVQKGAEKLGLNTQTEKQTLTQLQKSGTPALLFLQDDGRIVTLTAIDDDRAVVIDRGLTQNVERSVLEKRYGGEALVPTKALTQNTAIVADDAVREVKLPSLDAEVPQQFVLRNTGATPITLQLEYPLLGVTESKLSRDVIPPGETATLDLKVKWRSILKAPYQNVLVSIQTNDPIVPRLQLAVLLTPPQGAGN